MERAPGKTASGGKDESCECSGTIHGSLSLILLHGKVKSITLSAPQTSLRPTEFQEGADRIPWSLEKIQGSQQHR